ncbi:eukaryotic translation initiation factor 4E [Cavenderia fasciculata]|uniref:Eukaryotic translation initiation factor 4E n=1 Tax=Cavenderia fasciculata TaxID=261658 RepID=F4Q354_CACFS|nr:eukaryotic translation initiation factor 4E [Cavenderia fasciculata]EGG16776.1 eukaryotic translation initiation factor 4E [Cavenderia fasciculata]|eukprot:XP_004355250.1 eukaryotic translation initiation factor 4E [Cavenderia fasciculata]
MTTSSNDVECLVENSANLSISEQAQQPEQQQQAQPEQQPQEQENNNEKPEETTTTETPNKIDQNLIKHPLQNRWSLWYDFHNQKISQDNWAEGLKRIISFDTVEDFWCIFNNLPQISSIKSGSSFHLFKEEIEPKWEDEANKKGGKWLFQFREKNMADNYWLQIVMASIGETFDSSDDICGLVYNSRKGGDKISVWTRHSSEKATLDIGRGLKVALETNGTIGYSLHYETKKKNLHQHQPINNNNYQQLY